MDEDTSIRVLHYRNPHLFWVEVINHDKYTLLQVGLFGVVPTQASLVAGVRVCTKVDRWDAGANDIVDEFLESKHQLCFQFTKRHDEHGIQTSIFNNQPHMFGEIFSVRKQDGVQKHLSNCLDNSVYALKSSDKFIQMLREKKIRTRLDDAEEIDVLQKIIEQYQAKGIWQAKKKIFFNNISPEQMAKLQTKRSPLRLTPENLYKHQILLDQQKSVISKEKSKETTKLRYQDFHCNDKASIDFVENAIKKFTVVSRQDDGNFKKPDTGSVLSMILVHDDELNPQGSGEEVDMSEKALGRANSRTHTNKPGIKELMKIKGKRKQIKDINQSNADNSLNTHEEGRREDFKRSLNMSRDKVNNRLDGTSQEKSCFCKHSVEFEKNSVNALSKRSTEERYEAYGPPMNNMQSLGQKLVVREIDESPPKVVSSSDLIWQKIIDWENSNVSDQCCKDVQANFVDAYSKCHKNSLVTGVERKTDFNDSKCHGQKSELNDSKSYDNFVQRKHGVENKNNGVISNTFLSDNIDNKTIAQTKSRYKLLEKMRRRNKKFNESVSSTDDSVVQKTNLNDTSSTNGNSKSAIDSEEELEEIHAKLGPKYKPISIANISDLQVTEKEKPNSNPYKNLFVSKSIFVEKLLHPLLLAHAKNDDKILPKTNMRDIPFNMAINNTLRNMGVRNPSRLQSVSWPYILRGHSMFIISAPQSGKTLGILPAVCNHVLDYNYSFSGRGPIVIIVCATAISVTNVANTCRMFLHRERVLACFSGIDKMKLVADLLNGCDVLVSTPSLLYSLLGDAIGVDLQRLTTLVFEDCERLEHIYESEVNGIHLYVKKMLKSRLHKQVKVQYVLASRKWCHFMNSLAKQAPDTIITFAAFQECVLYSKTQTTFSFVQNNNKVDAVLQFLKETDHSKLTVIVCRSDDEVNLLESTLTALNYAVVACNNQMALKDLYKVRTEGFSSILICCDGNLKCLNVTCANYLVQFSMPADYTHFCKRFAVLNDNYASIFGPASKDVKIKILLDKTNTEELPKILQFIERCSSKVPEELKEIARKVLEQKNLEKAERLVILCRNVLASGECVDMYNCKDRHAILKGYDEPKSWMPRNGVITFKVINYHSATSYSVRLLTHVTQNEQTKYPETYKTLSMKLGVFFSKNENKKNICEPKVGDVCAVAMRKSFMSRCQVLQIIYEKGQAESVLINLIDEEMLEIVRAVELYFLPEEFQAVDTYVARVLLASVKPLDNDLTFSELAVNNLKKITDDDKQIYLKGRVVMTIGNTIFVSTLKVCAELSALCETVVKFDFKKMLLDTHAVPDPDHLSKLKNLCDIGNLKVRYDTVVSIPNHKTLVVKRETEYRWAHLDKNDWADIIFSNTINAGKFFVRLEKFSKCIDSLISEIKKHVADNPQAVKAVCVNDVVLAEFPDDGVFERAIIEEIIDDTKVKCFFVDNADWREVAVNKLKPIPLKFIKQIPFQSIECRLIGVKPPGEDWTEFSTNWLHDNCLEDEKGNSKRMYVKYFATEKAELTGGNKYSVILVDTTTEDDIVINKRLIDLNLASVEEEELKYLEKPLDLVREKTDTSSFDDDFDELEVNAKELQLKNVDEKRGCKNLIPIPIKLLPNVDEKVHWETNEVNDIADNKMSPYVPKNSDPVDGTPRVPLKNIFGEKPIRSMPLVTEDDEDSDKWDVCFDEDLGKCFGLPKLSQYNNKNKGDKQASSNEFHIVTSERENVIATSKLPAKDDKNNFGQLTVMSHDDMADVHRNKLKLARKDDKLSVKLDSETLNKTQATEDIEAVGSIQINKKITPIDKKKYETIQTDRISERSPDVDTETIKKDTIATFMENNGLELTNDLCILRGEIEDVSLYDSDDTLSITTNDKIEISMEQTKKLYINKPSILDSDDTQSILTEIDTEPSINEIEGFNKSVLDSDDSDIEAVRPITENPRDKAKNVRDEYQSSEHDIIKVNNGISKQLKTMQVDEAAKFKGKVIPITEFPNADIALNASLKNSRLNKIVAEKKATIRANTYAKDKAKIELENVKANTKVEKESTSELKGTTITVTQTPELVRTPQLVWRQVRDTITIKIKVVVDEYTLETGNRSMHFSAYQNDVKYAFDIELYGVIDKDKTIHFNKGQYILVTIKALLKKMTKWLKLTKDFKNWIIYDVDSIDTSSDEETPVNDDALKIIMDHHEKAIEMDNLDDDDMDDVSGYRYRYV